MNKEQETRLKSIEYHLDVATNGDSHTARVFHYAQADLANTDVPYLLELVRSQDAQLEAQARSLETIAGVVKRWEQGELASTEDGIVWREPVWPLPPGTDAIRTALKEGVLLNEGV
jgi:hypothetical protein